MRPKIRGKLIGAFATLLLVQLPAVATAQSSFSINDVTVNEGNPARFTVRRTGSDGSASVMCSAFGGTSTATGSDSCNAKERIDFLTGWQRLTFDPGETAKEFTVGVCFDNWYEPNETIVVMLEGATGGTIADDRGEATIIDDDYPEIRIYDVRLNEGNSGQTNVAVPVYLSSRLDQEVRVEYVVLINTNDTASAGSSCGGTADFVRPPVGTALFLTFPPNSDSQTISVPVCGDTTVEPDKTFTVGLVGTPSNASIVDCRATVTIVNDDTAAIPALSIRDLSVTEPSNTGKFGPPSVSPSNAAYVTLTLSTSNHAGCSIDYTCVRGTAGPAPTLGTPISCHGDYKCASGTVQFARGETSKTIRVDICNDTTDESNETFQIQLSRPIGLTAPDTTAVVTIVDND